MALSFQPKAGAVLMCDFDGFIEPEIVKKRPVVVIAKNKNNPNLVTVVPLSTTPPEVMLSHHYQLPTNPVPASKGVTCWAKGDMVSTVSIVRMDRLKDGWNRVTPTVTAKDLDAIRLCVVNALQLKNTLLGTQAAAAAAAAAVITAAAATGSAAQAAAGTGSAAQASQAPASQKP